MPTSSVVNDTEEGNRGSVRALLALLAVVLFALLISGCQRCQSQVPLAKLLGRSGEVRRDHARAENAWQPAAIGAEFGVGDAVKTELDSSAELRLDDGSVLRLEATTLVRFLDKKPGSEEQAVDLVTGAATLQAGEEGTLLRTQLGSARLARGSKLVLRRGDQAVTYKVLVGEAHLESGSGGVDLSAGQEVTIALGQAELETPPAPVASAEPALPPPPTGPISADVKGGAVSLIRPGEKTPARLAPGSTTLAPGSVLVVGKGSQVEVSQGAQFATLAADGRYLIGGNGHLVSVERGEYTLRSDGPVRVEVPGGVIVTTGGAAVLRREDQATSISVQSGTVELRGKNRETLVSGEKGRLTDAGQASVSGRGLNYADLDLAAGSGFVVHDPSPPTAIRFHFEKQCSEGVVRLKGPKAPTDDVARGKGNVSLAVGPGTVEYEVSCAREDGSLQPAVATGKVTVLADAGTRSVPEKAPSTFVDVNGRSYTVLYQNQLPQVTARWSPPPSGVSGYQLHVASGSRKRTLKSAQGAYTFPSGSLGEGTHTLYFEGGGRVSRKSSVTILFDNATPTAALQTPANSGVGPGGSLVLVGAALPGWGVAVDGRPIALDADGRFSVGAHMPADGRPLAVFLTHPTRGSHVYLRRPAGRR